MPRSNELTNGGKVAVLPEDLFQALTDNQEVARQIDQLRQQRRTEKKRLAQEARERKMKEFKLNKDTSRLSESSSASPNPVAQAQPATGVEGDAGHVCCISREGYRHFPKKLLSISPFTEKVDLEPFEAKSRKTLGYNTVTDFNLIHSSRLPLIGH